MKIATIALVLFFVVPFVGLGQNRHSQSPAPQPKKNSPSVRPSNILPSESRGQAVYIQFKSYDKQNGVVTLTLVNRTRWSIGVPVVSASDFDKKAWRYEIEPEYELEFLPPPVPLLAISSQNGKTGAIDPEDELPPLDFPNHASDIVSPPFWLPAGRVAVFRVPKRYLSRKKLRLVVPITYEWEGRDNSVLHRVAFYRESLPEHVQADIR